MSIEQYRFGDQVSLWHSDSNYLFLGVADPKNTSTNKPCAYLIAENSKAVECWKLEDISRGWKPMDNFIAMQDHVANIYVSTEGLSDMPTIEEVTAIMDDQFTREAWGSGENDYRDCAYGILDLLVESYNYNANKGA